MKLNTLSKIFATKGSFHLSYNAATMLLIGAFTIVGFAILGGYRLACWRIAQNQGAFRPQLQHALQRDSHQIQEIDPKTEQHLQVLTQHIGRIEANLMRINALGERLVETANLDPNEFNFGHEVAMGGPLDLGQESILHTLKQLDEVLEKRYTQLNTLHIALQTKLGQSELSLSGLGKPVRDGWISSFFGSRSDPYTGRKAWHAGVDIVGKEGSHVKALAGGVVTYADVKGGYGNLVEIQHADGLSTRYGHNKALLVSPGQLVKKGQSIALLGSSGRSTGPHVHLEVHKDGEAIDPGHYFDDLRRK